MEAKRSAEMVRGRDELSLSRGSGERTRSACTVAVFHHLRADASYRWLHKTIVFRGTLIYPGHPCFGRGTGVDTAVSWVTISG